MVRSDEDVHARKHIYEILGLTAGIAAGLFHVARKDDAMLATRQKDDKAEVVLVIETERGVPYGLPKVCIVVSPKSLSG